VTIAFCTTCRNRTEHLKRTLPHNLLDNPHSKFIVLNYGSQDDLLQYVSIEHQREIAEGRLVIYTHLHDHKFRMAHAKNMAHRLGIMEGADILVNLDADNLTGPRFEDSILQDVDNRIFLWARMVKGEFTRGISGRIAVHKQDFIKAGGYDEAKFNEWGSDDKDFNIRLRRLGCEGVEIEPQYLNGIPHNDKVRFREYPHLSEYEDDSFAVNQGTVAYAIANNGVFGCGTVFRNLDFSTPIVLEPLPTRIFGIGTHKTATASLHHAMQILGFDSWHWSSAHAAKAIWREMNTIGHSETLERYYALCDLPIPLLYWKLDVAYPRSKFILTVRDENKWLESARKHFDPAHNKWQAGWSQDPFTNRVHNFLYGRMDFEPDVFLERYRRHNAEVIEYFRGRPDDLLVMDMDNKTDWFDLCSFLRCTVPSTQYPYVNSSL
jgi:hypothetical protein